MKIAWLTPFSRRSAIGHCSAIIVEELRQRVPVTVFASDLARDDDPEAWLPEAEIRAMPRLSAEELLAELAAFDLCVYQLGDNLEFHRVIYDMARAVPGITVLHDVVMHHFFTGYYLLHRRDPAGYVAEADFAHGADGRAYAEAVLAGAGIDLMQDPALLRFNMAKSAIHRSDGVIVHSAFAYQTVAAEAECPVVHVPFPAPGFAGGSSPAQPARRRDDSGRVRLLTFGTVNPNKRIAEVVAAIGANPVLRTRVEYRIIGSLANEGYVRQVRRAIAADGLRETVSLLGHRSAAELRSALAQADVVINLRNPHFGESSWSLLEASFAGQPSLVWRHGYYDEFPDDAVAKVASLAELGLRLAALCEDGQERRRMGERARAFARQAFSTARYCDRLLAFAACTRRNRPVLRLVDTVATGLAELRQPADSAAAELVRAEIAALLTADGTYARVAVEPARGGRRDA